MTVFVFIVELWTKRYEWNEIAELNAFVCVCEGFKMSVSRPETGGMGGAGVHKDGE